VKGGRKKDGAKGATEGETKRQSATGSKSGGRPHKIKHYYANMAQETGGRARKKDKETKDGVLCVHDGTEVDVHYFLC